MLRQRLRLRQQQREQARQRQQEELMLDGGNKVCAAYSQGDRTVIGMR
jgi:hypothetical protein